MSVFTVGIDIGTTGTKAVLFEVGKGIVATANRSTVLESPRPGFAEADVAQWQQNIHGALADLVAQSAVDPAEVVGIATSGMVPAVVLLDRDLRAIRPAILQNDARAVVEIEKMRGELDGVHVLEDTGSTLSQQSLAPTLRWLQKHEAGTWDLVEHVMGSYDWALVALGARPHVEQNWALESGLFYVSGEPHAEIIAKSGLEKRQLPEVLAAGANVGELSRASAQLTGLKAGTPLLVGGADHVLSAYGAGVASEGDWLIKLGGAGDILVNCSQPLIDERLYLDAHPVEGGWLPNGCMATSGSLIRWFQALTGIEDLAAMDVLAEGSSPGEILCLPYFLGEKSPIHDPDLRGAFFGMHLGTTKADMYRSVLEAIAFGFRHHMEIFLELGVPLNRAMITNGGSKSTLWKQIHADVLGIELHPIVDHPGAALGAAVIAGVGVGVIGSMEEIKEYIVLGTTVHPREKIHEVYDSAYSQWRELAELTAPIAHAISERTRS